MAVTRTTGFDFGFFFRRALRSPREVELAGLLVEALAARFEPGKYKDTYRENLRALLDAKIRGEELKLAASAPMPAPVPDILEGLKASLARFQKPAAGAVSMPTAVAQAPPARVSLRTKERRLSLTPVEAAYIFCMCLVRRSLDAMPNVAGRALCHNLITRSSDRYN